MILSDGQLVLRPFRAEDEPDLARLANNKKVADNLRNAFPYPYSEADARAFLSMVKSQDPQITFAIVYSGALAGTIGLVPGSDIYSQSAELGYWLGEPCWNKGIMTQAIPLIVHHAFTALNLIRLHAGVFEYNTASRRVLEKCGFVLEGIFRKAIFKNGKFYNEYRYALLKE